MILYLLFVQIIKYKSKIPEHINLTGPILTYRSQKGLDFIENLSNKYNTFWKYWGDLGIILATITAIGSIAFVVVGTISLIISQEEVLLQPTDVIVIPGVNQFLPLEVALEIILAMFIAIVIHEIGHAILCYVGDINVKSTGFILGFLIPIGAFVEPDDNSTKDKSERVKLRMFAAGIMNNYAVFLISIILIFVLMVVFITPITGAGLAMIHDDSPADRLNLSEGDHITAIDNTSVTNQTEYRNKLTKDSSQIEINNNQQIKLENSAYIAQLYYDFNDIKTGQTITHVDDKAIQSPEYLSKEIQNIDSYYTNITMKDNTEYTIPIGAIVTDRNKDIFDTQNQKIIFSINEHRVYNQSDIESVIEQNDIEEIELTFKDKETSEISNITTTITELNSLESIEHTAGIQSTRLGIQFYPSEQYYSYLTPPSQLTDIPVQLYGLIILPFASLTPIFSANFPGFTEYTQYFFTVNDTVNPTIIFSTITILFWVAWLNINLAIFNAIPTFALDGGHISKSLITSVFETYVSEQTMKILDISVKSIILIALIIILTTLFI